MINIDYKWLLWLRRCGPTSTPNGSSSGSTWTTSSISSCPEPSSRSTPWYRHQPQLQIVRMLVTVSQRASDSPQVTFTRTRYHDAVKRWHWQDRVRPLPRPPSPACSARFSGWLHTSEEPLLFVTLWSHARISSPPPRAWNADAPHAGWQPPPPSSHPPPPPPFS